MNPTQISHFLADKSKPIVDDLLTPGGKINIDDSLKHKVGFASKVASDTGITILENSGYISSGLMSAGFETSKCLGLKLREYHSCDAVATTLAVGGAVTGGASNHIANLTKMSKIDIENLSFVLGILGSDETAMATTWSKINSLKGEENGIQPC